MSHDIETTVKQIMADVLGLPVELIGHDTAIDTTPTWDSATHINLVLAIEQEFSVSFDVPDIESMISFSDIVEAIGRKC